MTAARQRCRTGAVLVHAAVQAMLGPVATVPEPGSPFQLEIQFDTCARMHAHTLHINDSVQANTLSHPALACCMHSWLKHPPYHSTDRQ